MHYDFDNYVDRTGTHALKWEARPGLIPLWVADMDLPCAEPILKALHARVDHGIFGYTGTLKEDYTDAVLGWMARRFDWCPKAEWIRYTAGVVQAVSFLVHLLSAPGDGIIIQKPVYGPFMMSVNTQDRVEYNSPLLKKPAANGSVRYVMDFEDLAVKFADPAVKGMILCNPHNPVGRVWTEDELNRLLQLAKANGKWIISDEIHCDIVRKGMRHTPLLKLAAACGWEDHVYACTSVSKSFNLAGMQLANTFIPNEETRKRWAGYVEGTIHIGLANPLSIAAMQAAYTESEDWLDEANAYIDDNLAFLRKYLAEKLPKAVMAECEGTYLAWVDFSAYVKDAAELTRRLSENAGVALSDGAGFGEEAPIQRINVACCRRQLREGLDRIVAELA